MALQLFRSDIKHHYKWAMYYTPTETLFIPKTNLSNLRMGFSMGLPKTVGFYGVFFYGGVFRFLDKT